MTVSHSRTLLMNLLGACISQVQSAINAFENSSVSDADTLTALQTAGSYCVSQASALPSFTGNYGQFFNAKTAETLSDGGASLVNASIVSPGAFQFSGMLQSVGPYNLKARCDAIKEAILTYKTVIDQQENNEIGSQTEPSFSGNNTHDTIVLT